MADTIVIAARWKDWAVPRVGDMIAAIRARSEAPIVVLGPTMEFTKDVRRIVQQYGALSGADRAAQPYEDRHRRGLSAELASRVRAAGATYVDKFDVLCGHDKTCPVIVRRPKTCLCLTRALDLGWSRLLWTCAPGRAADPEEVAVRLVSEDRIEYAVPSIRSGQGQSQLYPENGVCIIDQRLTVT
jgi:hypothetical protein